MSNAETPINRTIFKAVEEFVVYIPRTRDKAIAKAMNHASTITTPGRLAVKDV